MSYCDKSSYWLYNIIEFFKRKWFTHCFLIIIMFVYTVGGAVLFLTIEGQNETLLIERDITFQVQELLHELRTESLRLPKLFSESEWRGEASRKIVKCEKRIKNAFDKHPLVVSHTNGRVWTIWNSIVYCSTLYTTIGYGHLYPTTFTGRVLTIVYSIIGIPLFLIALTDLGKLFTRGIKYLWSYIRRIYYKGNCLIVRNTKKHFLKGAEAVFKYAKLKRNASSTQDSEQDLATSNQATSEAKTPSLSNFEINDEFNLPVTLALFILVTYMLIGTVVFMFWENWDFFASFYFVFISMSTIGFGDIVPEKPIYMILSTIYLCFGLALMSMCINVVQDKLSDTFSKASVKLSSTIGIENDATEDT